MAYLFHTQNGFTIVDSTTKNSIFYQTFSSSHSGKPVPIFSQPVASYSACMDASNKLYVAISPDAFHLNYYTYENNRFLKNVLVSNQNSNYMISSPIIYHFQTQTSPSIVYLSHQLHSQVYQFISETPYQHQLVSLLTLSTTPYCIKNYTLSNAIWIFFITSDTCYHLQALHITDTETHYYNYLNLSEPIIDYSICIEDELLHIAYVSELHGKYQLSYFNTFQNKLTHLLTTQSPCNPAVFCYYNMIWLHIIVNHRLQMMLSIDEGQSFSTPTPCSIQNNVYRSFFFTQKVSPFIGQELYASIGSTLKLCTIAMIDLPRFHLDSHISTELELLIEGFLLALENTVSSPSVQTDKASLSSHPISAHNLNAPTLERAKNDFMQDLAGWELPPKI